MSAPNQILLGDVSRAFSLIQAQATRTYHFPDLLQLFGSPNVNLIAAIKKLPDAEQRAALEDLMAARHKKYDFRSHDIHERTTYTYPAVNNTPRHIWYAVSSVIHLSLLIGFIASGSADVGGFWLMYFSFVAIGAGVSPKYMHRPQSPAVKVTEALCYFSKEYQTTSLDLRHDLESFVRNVWPDLFASKPWAARAVMFVNLIFGGLLKNRWKYRFVKCCFPEVRPPLSANSYGYSLGTPDERQLFVGGELYKRASEGNFPVSLKPSKLVYELLQKTPDVQQDIAEYIVRMLILNCKIDEGGEEAALLGPQSAERGETKAGARGSQLLPVTVLSAPMRQLLLKELNRQGSDFQYDCVRQKIFKSFRLMILFAITTVATIALAASTKSPLAVVAAIVSALALFTTIAFYNLRLKPDMRNKLLTYLRVFKRLKEALDQTGGNKTAGDNRTEEFVRFTGDKGLRVGLRAVVMFDSAVSAVTLVHTSSSTTKPRSNHEMPVGWSL